MKLLFFTLTLFLSSLCLAEGAYYPLNSPENTPLFIAIAQGDFEKAEDLLENGADPNKKSVKGATVFHALVLNSDEPKSIEFLYKLIKYEGNVNAQDDDGDTGFGFAILQNKYLLAQAFLQNKHVNVYIKNNHGLNILHLFYIVNLDNPYAYHTLHIALYRGGAKLMNDPDNDGQTALHFAVTPGHENIELLKALVFIPEVALNMRDYTNGNTPILTLLLTTFSMLQYAMNSDEEITSEFFEQISKVGQALEILLNPPHQKLDLTLKNNKGTTAYDIMIAVSKRLITIPKNSPIELAFEPVKKALKVNLNNNPLDSPENTPLFMAIAQGDFKKAEDLLKNGANPNEKSVKGATVFHALALNNDEQGSIEFLPTLFHYGANINAQDEEGDTGLSVAIVTGKYLLAQAFLQNEHIDILIKNNQGSNILHTFSYVDLNDSPDSIKTLNMILALGGAELINDRNNDGHAPIHYALGYDNIKLLSILAAHPGTNLNIADNEGNVPVLKPLIVMLNILRHALLAEDDVSPSYSQIYKVNQALEILLKHNVDLTIKNNNNLSPYEVLLTFKEMVLELPQNSPFYLAFEPIMETISANNKIKNQ